jgi:hypothetical protein
VEGEPLARRICHEPDDNVLPWVVFLLGLPVPMLAITVLG